MSAHAAVSPQRKPNTHPLTTIANLTPYSLWSLHARVTSKAPLRQVTTKKSTPSSILNIILVDSSMSEIQGTFFGKKAEEMDQKIQVGKTYSIVGGSIKIANRKFNRTKHDYEINFDDITTFDEFKELDSNIPKFVFNFSPLTKIQAADNNPPTDIIGVVVQVESISSIKSKKGENLIKRNIKIADESGLSAEVTLWNENANKEIEKDHIIAIKSAYISEFRGGKQVSSSQNSIIMIDPELPEAAKLKQWYAEAHFNVEESKSISSPNVQGEFSAPLTYIKAIESYDLGVSQQNYFSVITNIARIQRGRKLIYTACPHPECKFKKISESGGSFYCENCKQAITDPAYRYAYSFNAADYTGSARINVIGDDEIGGEILGGIGAAEFNDKTKGLDDRAMELFYLSHECGLYKLRLRAKTEEYREWKSTSNAPRRERADDGAESGEHRSYGGSNIKVSLMRIEPVNFAEAAKQLAKEFIRCAPEQTAN